MEQYYFDAFENELNDILENYGLDQALIHYKIFIDEDIINNYNSLKYKDYLKTIYWKIIKQIKLRAADYTCQKCEIKDILEVHHETYKHKGLEFIFFDDLICLCEKCHKEEHKK